MRRIYCLLLIIIFLLLVVTPVWAEPMVTGCSAILIDVQSGQVLFEKEKNKKLFPASTTKILTAIIAIESGKLDNIVTIGPNPPKVAGTRVYLVEGEKVKLRDLVKVALLHSANDAALAVGEYISGSSSAFAKVMNDKAKKIGAVNSNFVNPHGLSDNSHYTTAHDLALIGLYAMKNETFRSMVNTKVLDWNGKDWHSRLININKMLWSYQGANGVKTGYTKEAGSTIVASAQRNNRELIAVVLDSNGTNLWKDASGLLDYGFQNFRNVKLANPSQVIATVSIDKRRELVLVPQKEVFLSLPGKGNKKIESRLSLLSIKGNINKGQQMGHLILYVDGKEYTRIELVARDSIIHKINYVNIALYLFAGLFFLQVFVKGYLLYRRNRGNRYSYSYYRSYYQNYR